MRDGLLAGDGVLMVMTLPHWEAITRRCRDNGVDVATARASGWLTVRDAHEALAEFMERDQPNWPLFNASIGTLVRGLSVTGARLRIYGEMVDILARANEFMAAEQLEEFWNRLREEAAFTLFCGYSAEHFGNPRDRATLRHICELHTHVESDPRDVLGSFLLKTQAAC